jgi:Lrp/AsnC family transcriptional regulator, leucine-responsive regulatory protein
VITLDIEGRLDSVDWALLAELQQNARMSYTELGRRVGLTPPAVIERIRRLEDSDVIAGYRVELNMERVGRPLKAVIRIAQNDARGCNLGAVLREMPEVLECDRITGEDCYTIKVAVATPERLEDFLDRLSVYGRTTTSIVLSSPISHRVVEPLEARGITVQNEDARALA